MRVAELRALSGETWLANPPGDLPDSFRHLVQVAALASAPDPIDPMEQAFHDLAERAREERPPAWTIARQYGLRPDLLAVTQAWCSPQDAQATVATKGAPEAIAQMCGIDGTELEQLHVAVKEMADRGLRVLAVAEAEHSKEVFPDSPRDFSFRFLGLVGLIDPIRPGVPEAVAELRGAGIRVVMVTGDHPQTARSIALAAGLDAGGVLTGVEIAAMTDVELRGATRNCNVFARILPQQKLRIVEALQQDGDVVAMTGDGVNDAPSLKAADIGIAMGMRGTDVAREASAIVLLDDNFSSIAAAVRLGRRIYDNLRKAMGFVLAVHIPIAGLALLPLLTGLPILFWPVHIAFLEMIIDPVCSLVFEAEAEEAGIMRRRPRRPEERLLPLRIMVARAAQGLIVFFAAAAVFILMVRSGADENLARATTLVALVGAIVALIVANRTFTVSAASLLVRPSPVLIVVLALVLGVLTLALTIPFVSNVFGFAPLAASNYLIAGGAVLAAFVLIEVAKLLVPQDLPKPA
jgi:Ca2+-transporting ATPase